VATFDDGVECKGYGMTELTSVSRKPVDVTNKPASIGELVPAAEAKVQ
jgi:long-subunit acyl-CoA synthetase (AMP-forming)